MFDYTPPIELIYDQVRMQIEGDILKAVQAYDINVDKEELIKALQYDRDQYEKGYEDGRASLRPKGEWISVNDRLPETETEVLILARHGKRNVITTGMYEDGRMNTEDSDWWWETDGFEYDEELDVYIIPEGWWEYKHYIDDEAHNYAIDGNVTHWMPLPEPPERGE